MNSNKCKHGYEVDANGNHIIPKEKSTAELIEEAKRLLNKKEPETIPTPKPQTEKEKELDREKKKWDNYFVMHPNERHKPFPKTIFDIDR